MAQFPESWWREERPLIFGHRGASRVAPQNTLAAFRRAAELGADGVELDVHLTAEGIPVVIHDARVDATTDGKGRVAELTLPQVKELDAGAHFDAAFAGERIPTLEEVLAEVGQRLIINIELKPSAKSSGGLEEAVVAVVRRMGMLERVWFSSFKPYALYWIRQQEPAVPCGLLYSPLTFVSRLLAPVTPHEALHPHRSLVREAMVRRAHRRGLRVVTWTLDDEDKAQRFAEWGVDVIITNEPERLLALWSEK